MNAPLTLISRLVLVGFGLSAVATAAEPARQRVEFREVDTLFANPGQGWMTSRREPPADPRFPYSVAYIRFNWADVEPEEGQYNWALIDRVIEAWKPSGATVAMRVMTTNAHSGGYYASPKWLFDAGCKGAEYLEGGDDPTKGGKRITRIEPDYADPIYLAKHGAFLEALGKRYDGHPRVEFLDIGSYGIWGEWHTTRPAPLAVRKRIVDLYLKAFQKTPLVFMTDDAEVLAYALPRGVGLRRDGVGSPWHEQNWIGSKKYAGVPGMAETWKRVPVVFEWYGNYEYLKSREWSFDAAVAFILRNHVTLINDNIGEVPPEAMAKLNDLARRAGYRFVLRSADLPKAVKRGDSIDVNMEWSNVGVGKLYRPYVVRLELRDEAGKAVAASDSEADPREWLPGDHRASVACRVPAGLSPGTYRLAVALVDSSGARPPLRLAIDREAEGGWYAMAEVAVE